MLHYARFTFPNGNITKKHLETLLWRLRKRTGENLLRHNIEKLFGRRFTGYVAIQKQNHYQHWDGTMAPSRTTQSQLQNIYWIAFCLMTLFLRILPILQTWDDLFTWAPWATWMMMIVCLFTERGHFFMFVNSTVKEGTIVYV